MAKRSKKIDSVSAEQEESFARIFFNGFVWPARQILKAFAWIVHQPPLKQIGHGLRWFFLLKPIRFLGKILGLGYFRDSWRELKLVTWPKRRESFRLTRAVIMFAVVFGIMIAIVDYGLDKLFKQVLLK